MNSTETEQNVSWVVYAMTVHNHPDGMRAVCEQSEWEELELARPGYHRLVQSGFTSEGEAERLARGTSGDTRKSGYVKKAH